MKKLNAFIIYTCLLLIFSLGAYVRFYHLGQIPTGISDDEADKGYDAYSLVKTGKDQWNQPTPLFAFKGFGDYRSPIYTYLIIPCLPVFGLSETAIRIPSAIAGTLTIIVVYGIGALLFRKSLIGLIAALFLAFNPWHIGMSKMAMEATVGVFFMSLGMFFFLVGTKKKFFMLLSAFFFALTFYTYPGYVVATPILIILLCIAFRQTFSIGKKTLLYNGLALGVFLLLALPMAVQIRTASSGIRMNQVNLTNDSGIVDRINEKRGACASVLPDPVCRITFNKYQAFFWQFLTNVVHHFSPDFLLTNGTTTQYSILPSRGLFYFTEWVCFITGVYVLLKRKNKFSYILLLFLLFSAIPDSLTGDGHYGRFFISIPFWQLISAVGVYECILVSKKPLIILVLLFIFVGGETLFFWVEYNTFFPFRYSRYSHFGYKELMQRVRSLQDEYAQVYISSRVNDTKQYIFYLFFSTYDPADFQTRKGVEIFVESNGWIRIRRIGNVHFVPSLPQIPTESYQSDKKVIFIAAPSEFPKYYIPAQFEIKEKNGDVIFRAVTLSDWTRCLEGNCLEEKK